MKPTLNMIIEVSITRVTRVYYRHFLSSSSGRKFMGKFIPAVQKNSSKRSEYELNDSVLIPAFIVMSVSNKGDSLYIGMEDGSADDQMTPDEWRAFFQEITDLGVNACLLVIGEPLLNMPALEVAAEFPQILFGAVCDPHYLTEDLIGFFAKNQNILPLITVEKRKDEDINHVKGMYASICENMHKKRIPYGNAFIVTKENIDLSCDKEFADMLKRFGSHFFVYMGYQSVLQDGSEKLELSSTQRTRLKEYVDEQREAYSDAVAMLCPDDLLELGSDDLPNLGYFVIKSNGAVQMLTENADDKKYTVKGVPLINTLREIYHIDNSAAIAAAEAEIAVSPLGRMI